MSGQGEAFRSIIAAWLEDMGAGAEDAALSADRIMCGYMALPVTRETTEQLITDVRREIGQKEGQ